MGILDDALDGVDESEQRAQAVVREQLAQKARSRATLDKMAADFARIANERSFPTRKVYGSARRAPSGWAVVVYGKEGDNRGYIVYPDGSWGEGWEVLHRSNVFSRPKTRLEAQRESAASLHSAEVIEQQFAEAVRSYASRGRHH